MQFIIEKKSQGFIVISKEIFLTSVALTCPVGI